MDTINRGSEWRVWDLHFHTPSSYDYQDKSITNEQLVEGLTRNNVSVVAITDHYIMDVPRMKELQRLGEQKGLTVFPGIEFCSELGGKQAVHFIGLFSPNDDLESIWTKIQGQCNLTPADIAEKGGYETMCCDFVPTCDLIFKLGGIVSVHGGSKSNSIEEIRNNLLQKQELKRSLLSKYHPILDCGKLGDAENYKNKVFPDIGFQLPVIICSDNHDIKDYQVKCKTWIKADCTFAGLKQVMYEPEERVTLSEISPDSKKSYSVIDHIELNYDNTWNQNIYFNPNLNVIVGGRSTGKSNLLSCVASNLSCSESAEYDDYVKSIKESVKVVWGDGETNNNRMADYLPQNYIYALANDDKKLNNFLSAVLLENKTIAEDFLLFKAKCNDNILEISNLLNRLLQLNRLKEEKVNEMRVLGDKKGIENEIHSLNAKKNEIEKNLDMDPKILKIYEDNNKILQEYNQKITLLRKEIKALDCLMLADPLVENANLNYDGLESVIENEIKQFILSTLNQANKSVKDAVVLIKMRLETILSNFYQGKKKIESSESFKQGLALFEKHKELLDLKNKIDKQRILLAAVKISNEKYDNLIADFQNTLSKLLVKHIDYLNLTKDIASKMHVEYDGVKLKTQVVFSNLLSDKLSDIISLKYKSMTDLIDKIIDAYQSCNEEKIKSVLEAFIYDSLNAKIMFKGNNDCVGLLNMVLTTNWYYPNIEVEYEQDSLKMMSPGKRTFVILKLLLDYSNIESPVLIDQPEDNLDNRAIYQELVSYIRKKKYKRQIILVTHNPNIVVGADAENVIVANQNGVKTPNTNGIKFQYVNGSLENSFKREKKGTSILEEMGIREHVCDILEGGEEAFKQRECKYGFSKF